LIHYYQNCITIFIRFPQPPRFPLARPADCITLLGTTCPDAANPPLPGPTPIQLRLFAETASLVRIRPTLNEWRYYRMEIWPDLFGRALLVRQWGRIGTEGRRRLDPHPDPGAAISALADILRAKRRRGYQDRNW
jgi:predicted DNA-binding WGR domain protein